MSNPSSDDPAFREIIMVDSPGDKTKSKRACMNCRVTKVRCDFETDESRCRRCIRLNLECVIKKHQRGRKRSPGRYSKPRSANENNQRTPSSRSGSSSSSSSTSSSVYREFSVEKQAGPEALDTDFLRGPLSTLSLKSNIPSSSSIWQDPVAKRYMSLQEAQMLFKFYFDKLNPLTGYLDPYLYTFDYVRAKSPILFTTILTAAAKFVHRSQYAPLQRLSQQNLALVWTTGSVSLEIIQSIIILVNFKSPTDSTAFIRIGVAIRMGFELGLDEQHIRRRPLPDDEIAAREIISGERTWYELVSFDEFVSRQRRKPLMIPADTVQNPVDWISKNPYKLDIDDYVAAKAEIGDLMEQGWKQMFAPSTGQAIATHVYAERGATLRTCFERLNRWRRRWIVENQMPGDLIPSQIMLSHFYAMSRFHLCTLDYRHHQQTPSSLLDTGRQRFTFVACYGASLALLEQISTEMSRNGLLRYVQEWIPLGTVSCVMWLYAHVSLMDVPMAESAIAIIEKVVASFAAVADHDDETPAYVCRFLQTLLKSTRRKVALMRTENNVPGVVDNGSQRQQPQQTFDAFPPFNFDDVQHPSSNLRATHNSTPIPADVDVYPYTDNMLNGDSMFDGFELSNPAGAVPVDPMGFDTNSGISGVMDLYAPAASQQQNDVDVVMNQDWEFWSTIFPNFEQMMRAWAY